MRFSQLISKYIILAIFPYFIFSWLLLTVVLFIQQGSRFSDIFFSSYIPKNLLWQLTFALVPNVIAFTCPMAVLVGVIIGLSRIQEDSELVSIRFAGIGNFQIVLPIIFIGITLSFFTFFINLYGVPFAAQIVRRVALQTALYKLESPIEPGVFNTEVNGFTIYVKEGDIERGTWENIFIFNEDKQNKIVRLITAKGGRIDSNEDVSELVLSNAVINNFSLEKNNEKFISESINQIRFPIKTRRGELIDKLSKTEESPEELGLRQLASASKTKEGKERIEIDIIWHRRILLSLTPLIFALLGTSLVLKFNRGGKGFGVFLALCSLVVYYLLALLGEQLARTNQISVFSSSLIPIVVSVVFILSFFLSSRFSLRKPIFNFDKKLKLNYLSRLNKVSKTNFYIDFSAGLLDFDIISSLLKYFSLTFSFLTVIYLIFTAFELWKFAGELNNGVNLLLKYLFFLLPFIYIQLVPSALMIATLATFVIKSRQNEVVTWTSAGRSVYRLLFPCFVLMIFFGLINWELQEKILPATNQIQENLRTQIRSKGVTANKEGKYWISSNNRIYSFELQGDKRDSNQKVKNLTIFEFSNDNLKLQTIYKSQEALWEKDKVKLLDEAEKITWSSGKIDSVKASNTEISEQFNPFINLYQKPSYLNVQEIKQQIENTESESEKRNYETALEKKYTTLFLPFIITLFTAPFALSLHRKGRVVTIGFAVGIWLSFMAAISAFEQFGLNGYISPKFAVWSPLLLFSTVGTFLISKIKT
jgi:LPS export ABC transporter permease LptG